MDLSATPVACGDTAVRIIDGLAYVVDAKSGALHELNEVGTRIFGLVDGQLDVAGIVSVIVDEYEVARDVAEDDVLAFLTALEEKQVVSVA